MPIRIAPALKGVITGILMIAVPMGIYYSGNEGGSAFQYIIYGLYAAGILWTLIAYKYSDQFTGKFGDLFMQGFRCFIVVTLMMVVFTFIFNRMHPEFAEESAKAYREHLMKQPDKLPTDIDEEVARHKKGYGTVLVYGAIFGYLIIGAGVTALVSGIVS